MEKKRKRLNDEAIMLCERSSFVEAKRALNKLLCLEEDATTKIDILFRIADCDVMSENSIQQSTDNMIQDVLRSGDISYLEICQKAQQHNGLSLAVRLSYATQLIRRNVKGYKAIASIEHALDRVTREVGIMMEQCHEDKAVRSVPLLHIMLENLRGVDDEDGNSRVVSEAHCLKRIGDVQIKLGNMQIGLANMQKGRDAMEGRFGLQAAKNSVFASLANCIANVCKLQGDFRRATIYQEKAIEELKEARDISDERVRELLEKYNRNLSVYKTYLCDQTLESIEDTTEIRKRVEKHLQSGAYMEAQEDMIHINAKDPSQGSNLDFLLLHATCQLMANGEITTQTNKKIILAAKPTRSAWRRIRKIESTRCLPMVAVLQLYACKFLTEEENPDIREITTCTNRCFRAICDINSASKQRETIVLISVMHDILTELQKIQKIDKELEAHAVTVCLNKIGRLYNLIRMPEQAKKFSEQGRSLMENVFEEDAVNYSVYSELAANIADAYEIEMKYSDAATYYEKAMADLRAAKGVSHLYVERYQTEYKKQLLSNQMKAVRTAQMTPEVTDSDVDHKVQVDCAIGEETGSTDTADNDLHSSKKHTMVGVGGGLCVDHTQRLQDGREVYRGTFQGEDIAVKKMNFSKRLKEAVETAKCLDDHQNVVRYVTTQEWSSDEIPGLTLLYIGMEMCEKKTLKELAKRRVYTEEERVSMLRQFLEGLRHIHRAGVIHGGLKPRTVLRSLEGKVKITGLGMTATRRKDGAYEWSAPEQQMTKMSDVYSAGLVVFFVLARGEMTPLMDKKLDFSMLVSKDFDLAVDLIERMTDREPNKRPTVEECLESPLFWEYSRKMEFVLRFYDANETSTYQHVADELGDSWTEKLVLEETEAEALGAKSHMDDIAFKFKTVRDKIREEGCSNISELLRLMKYCYESTDDTKFELRDVLADSSSAWHFFNTRFPNLFLFAYKKVHQTSSTNSMELSEAGASGKHVVPQCTTLQTANDTCAGPSRKGARSRTPQKPSAVQFSSETLFHVGNGIEVDHTTRLKENFEIYCGRYEGKLVAVKKLAYSSSHAEEVEIIKTLSPHPNIVEYLAHAIFDCCDIPGRKDLYLAMEMCDKYNLYECIKGEELSEQDRLDILRQIIRGISHIHNKDIVHRDLKPQNVLRSLDGPYFKIADFGISEKLHRDKVVSAEGISTAGTIGWKAPDRLVSKMLDIFSTGLIFFFVLTDGKFPELGQEYPDFSELRCTDPKMAKDLISQMLSTEPDKRPTILQINDDPIFWSDTKKLEYKAAAISDRKNSLKQTLQKKHLTDDEKMSLQTRSLQQQIGKGFLDLKTDHLLVTKDPAKMFVCPRYKSTGDTKRGITGTPSSHQADEPFSHISDAENKASTKADWEKSGSPSVAKFANESVDNRALGDEEIITSSNQRAVAERVRRAVAKQNDFSEEGYGSTEYPTLKTSKIDSYIAPVLTKDQFPEIRRPDYNTSLKHSSIRWRDEFATQQQTNVASTITNRIARGDKLNITGQGTAENIHESTNDNKPRNVRERAEIGSSFEHLRITSPNEGEAISTELEHLVAKLKDLTEVHEVGTGEKTIRIGGCSIAIPKNTFSVPCSITCTIKTNLDDLELPESVLAVAPVIKIKCNERPAQLVTFTLPTFVRVLGDSIPIIILKRQTSDDGSSTWQRIPAKGHQLRQSHHVKFITSHFCDFVAVVESDDNTCIPLMHYLGQKNDEFLAMFCKTAIVTELNSLDPKQELRDLGYKQLHTDEILLSETEIDVVVKPHPSEKAIEFEPSKQRLRKDLFRSATVRALKFILEVKDEGSLPSKVKLSYEVGGQRTLLKADLKQQDTTETITKQKSGQDTRTEEQVASVLLYKVIDAISGTNRLKFLRSILGIPEAVIETISKDHKEDSTEACYQMLNRWLKGNGGVNRKTANRLVEIKDDFLQTNTTT